jgi:hypothetical protein
MIALCLCIGGWIHCTFVMHFYILINNQSRQDTELATEVEKTIQQADGSAYMAIFVTTSSSSTPPAKYYKDAKIEIERCAKTLDELALMIGLK